MCEIDGETDHNHELSRRRFLQVSSAAAFTVSSATGAFAAETLPPQNAIAPEVALQRLMDGNARYAANMPNRRDFSAGRAARAKSQYPIAAVLSCADSRVAPELAFDQDPGDLFVMRVAGNVMSPHLLASLEYGVKFLNVPLVVVLGHSNCGAVSAAIKVLKEEASLPGHLPELIAAIKPAVAVAKKSNTNDLLESAIAENVQLQVAQLRKSPPIIQPYYDSRKIDIIGGVYDLKTGRIAFI